MYLIKTVCYSDRFLFFTFFSLLVVINRWNRDSGLHSVLSVLRFHGFFRAGKITEGLEKNRCLLRQRVTKLMQCHHNLIERQELILAWWKRGLSWDSTPQLPRVEGLNSEASCCFFELIAWNFTFEKSNEKTLLLNDRFQIIFGIN